MIHITARGKKGAAPRELHREIRALEGKGVPAGAVAALRKGQIAANKIIPMADRGSDIHVQLAAEDDPLGGWSVSVLVDVSPPRPRARS